MRGAGKRVWVSHQTIYGKAVKGGPYSFLNPFAFARRVMTCGSIFKNAFWNREVS